MLLVGPNFHAIGWPKNCMLLRFWLAKEMHAIGVQEWAGSLDLQCGLFGPSGLV